MSLCDYNQKFGFRQEIKTRLWSHQYNCILEGYTCDMVKGEQILSSEKQNSNNNNKKPKHLKPSGACMHDLLWPLVSSSINRSLQYFLEGWLGNCMKEGRALCSNMQIPAPFISPSVPSNGEDVYYSQLHIEGPRDHSGDTFIISWASTVCHMLSTHWYWDNTPFDRKCTSWGRDSK